MFSTFNTPTEKQEYPKVCSMGLFFNKDGYAVSVVETTFDTDTKENYHKICAEYHSKTPSIKNAIAIISEMRSDKCFNLARYNTDIQTNNIPSTVKLLENEASKIQLYVSFKVKELNNLPDIIAYLKTIREDGYLTFKEEIEKSVIENFNTFGEKKDNFEEKETNHQVYAYFLSVLGNESPNWDLYT